MTTGTKKTSDTLLKLGIGICICYTLLHLAEFVVSTIPPYREGQCLSTPNPVLVIKVDENHYLQGYSIVELQILGDTVKKGPVEFEDLSNPMFKPTECGK